MDYIVMTDGASAQAYCDELDVALGYPEPPRVVHGRTVTGTQHYTKPQPSLDGTHFRCNIWDERPCGTWDAGPPVTVSGPLAVDYGPHGGEPAQMEGMDPAYYDPGPT